ncbi:MAG: permease-like cell division protein FtsX [Clostridiaceae bacterium]
MKTSTIKLFIQDAIKSIIRNLTLSLASAATVAFTLFLLGAFVLASLNINRGISTLQDKLEIKVFLKNAVTEEQKTDIEDEIESISEIKAYKYESKDDALEKAKEMFDNDESMVKQFQESNPFPESYSITVKSADDITKISSELSQLDGVEDVNAGKETVRNFQKTINTVKYVGSVLLVILGGVSIFLIANTTKLTVYSRRKEISIMKHIGATDWFIRWPFIIEGIFIGIIGSAISIGLLFLSYKFILKIFGLDNMNFTYVKTTYILTTMTWEFVLIGIILGAAGSILAVRKFLKV